MAEVFRLGTAKARENLDFRRHLASAHVPDAPFQILASEIARQTDCIACANCCRYSLVAVQPADIHRIATHLGITAEEVTRLYTVPDSEDPGTTILRNSADGCVFLDHNLCMIYDSRPKACRDFPHVTAGTHSLGSRRSSHDRWTPLCPILYNATESYKHLTGYHPRENHTPNPDRV
ncbi:MAG: YkgJ family cysteine cluster protein [Acidobacteria bacterium]|nr:YkgJ family cysteine cluster protein [Acidobacteriota bacterium]